MSVGYQNGGNNQQPKAQQGGDADWDTLKGDVGDIAGVAVERGRHFLDSAREQKQAADAYHEESSPEPWVEDGALNDVAIARHEHKAAGEHKR